VNEAVRALFASSVVPYFLNILTTSLIYLCSNHLHYHHNDIIVDIQESQEVVKVLNIISNPKEELPVKRAGADNTSKWSSFAKRILKHARYWCYAHETGES
jgi:hypothetical protein